MALKRAVGFVLLIEGVYPPKPYKVRPCRLSASFPESFPAFASSRHDEDTFYFSQTENKCVTNAPEMPFTFA